MTVQKTRIYNKHIINILFFYTVFGTEIFFFNQNSLHTKTNKCK